MGLRPISSAEASAQRCPQPTGWETGFGLRLAQAYGLQGGLLAPRKEPAL